MQRALPVLIIAAVFVTTVAVAWLPKRSTMAGRVATLSPHSTPATTSSARGGHPGAEPPHAVGPADAPVTLEAFGDFQCPPCAMVHPTLKAMEKEFGPQL